MTWDDISRDLAFQNYYLFHLAPKSGKAYCLTYTFTFKNHVTKRDYNEQQPLKIRTVISMPRVHECNHLGCHAVIPATEKFCQRHKQEEQQRYAKYNHQLKLQSDQQYNRDRRDQEANAFYHSARWTRTRDYIKQRDYMTDSVDGRVLNDHDYIVDHVVPRRLSADPYNVNNLWLLSRRHHNIKTRYEEQMSDGELKHMTRNDWRNLIMKSGDTNG